MYWAQELAEQTSDAELQESFTGVAQALTKQEDKIVAELNAAQGPSVDINGYFFADTKLAEKSDASK